jgi:acyl-CoA dehydrogenase
MKGPRNYIVSGYESIPVAITVEGANILTRNLMIFGQGATRSHPYVLKEMHLAAKGTNEEVIGEFDNVLFKHIGFSISNGVRAFLLAMTSSHITTNPGHASLGRYYAYLTRLSAAFALIADVTMLSLQSKLKTMEMLSARLGDLLSDLYLASMVLKHYENDGCPDEDLPVVQWSLDYLINHYQEAFRGIIHNYPSRPLAYLLRILIFPLGMHFKAPCDKLETRLVQTVTENNATRDRLVSGLYMGQGGNNPLAHVNEVFLQSLALEPLHKNIRQAIKDKALPRLHSIELIEKARDEGVISKEEADQLIAFDKRLMSVIHVDDFEQDELIRIPCSDVA